MHKFNSLYLKTDIILEYDYRLIKLTIPLLMTGHFTNFAIISSDAKINLMPEWVYNFVISYVKFVRWLKKLTLQRYLIPYGLRDLKIKLW